MLQWAATLNFSPPPVRILLYHQASSKTKDRFHHIFAELLSFCIDSTPPFDDGIDSEDRTVFHVLATIFPALVFAPRDPNEKTKVDTVIGRRMVDFMAGGAKDLFQYLYNVPCLTPREKKAKADREAEDVNKIAQIAADGGNYKAAIANCTDRMPRALFEGQVAEATYNLYISELPDLDDTRPTTRRRAGKGNASTSEDLVDDVPDEEILSYIRQVKTGKAAGPFADVTDFLRNLALAGTQSVGNRRSYPYLPTVVAFVSLLTSNRIPPKALDFITALFYTALHKDWPNNPGGTHEVGGTAR